MTMEVWMGPGAYIISYPISNGKDFNMVISHHRLEKVREVQPDVPLDEMKAMYKDWDPRIRRVLDMIESISRWPLLVTPPLPQWYNKTNNVVLLGDAAHSMVNHMAQGAATSMEDGAFLARCIAAHILSPSSFTLPTALDLYTRSRKPLAKDKQEVSFLNGALWMVPDGPIQRARDEAMSPEIRNEPYVRSPNLYADPTCVLDVYAYDAEAHAEVEIRKAMGMEEERVNKAEVYAGEMLGDADIRTEQYKKWMGWLAWRIDESDIKSGKFASTSKL